MTEPEALCEADPRVAARMAVWRRLEWLFALAVIVLGTVSAVASLASGGGTSARIVIAVGASEAIFGAVWLGLGSRLRGVAGVGFAMLVALPATYASVVSGGFWSQVAYYASLVGAVLACAPACRGLVRDYPVDAASTPVGELVPGWRVAERLFAWTTTLLASLAVVGWLVALIDVHSVWAWVSTAVSTATVAFGVLWLRWRERLWWGAGLCFLLVMVGPVAFARVTLPGVWPQVATWLGLASLLTSALMLARKEARRRDSRAGGVGLS